MAFVSNGTTIADAGAFSASLGSMVLIKTLTASSSATLSFVNGSSSVVLDGTYPIYKFVFINMHPETNGKGFGVNFSDDTSSHSYDLTKTSSVIETYHAEDGSESTVCYHTGVHLALMVGISPETQFKSQTYKQFDSKVKAVMAVAGPTECAAPRAPAGSGLFAQPMTLPAGNYLVVAQVVTAGGAVATATSNFVVQVVAPPATVSIDAPVDGALVPLEFPVSGRFDTFGAGIASFVIRGIRGGAVKYERAVNVTGAGTRQADAGCDPPCGTCAGGGARGPGVSNTGVADAGPNGTDCSDSACAADPACQAPACLDRGAVCSSNSACCSNRCKGRGGNKTCQ